MPDGHIAVPVVVDILTTKIDTEVDVDTFRRLPTGAQLEKMKNKSCHRTLRFIVLEMEF